MAESKEARNKALVLKAFDTLFNKRDYAVAQRLWSPNYIQHGAHIAPGREGLFNLIKSLPPTLKYEPGIFCPKCFGPIASKLGANLGPKLGPFRPQTVPLRW